MKNTAKWTLIGLILVAVTELAVTSGQDKPNPSPSSDTKLRIGTFRRTEVLVAYYRSSIHAKVLDEIQKEHGQAKTAGDKAKQAELEKKGGDMQEVAHRQLAGEAPLVNICDYLKDKWPAIAKEARVHLIVEETLYVDEQVEKVDITDLIVKQFPPSRKPAPK